MEAREVMTTTLRTLTPEGRVREALECMNEFNVRHVPVVADGRLVGMVSDRDLRVFLADAYNGFSENIENELRLDSSISNVMQTDLVTATATTEVVDIVDLLLENKIGAVPIVAPDGRHLEGIVSYENILEISRDFLS